MRDYKFAVLVGRFQPFHNGHFEIIKHGLKIADKVIVVVGSASCAPDIKNPFSLEIRKQMILGEFNSSTVEITRGADYEATVTEFTYPEYKDRVIVFGVRDYFYQENVWLADIQAKLGAYIEEGDSVAILGDYKDESSYYIKYFPQWDFKPAKDVIKLNATDIRSFLFSASPKFNIETGRMEGAAELAVLKKDVPESTFEWLKSFVRTDGYVRLCEEFKQNEQYKAIWANAPFPPTFVTVDTVVICSGHVLVVKRKFNPGKGLYALPGGFVKNSERIEDAALRELKEETGIRVDKLVLRGSIEESKVFDYPERSRRGRTITHAYYIKLKDGKLPEVRGNDDASAAFWMPLKDVMVLEPSFFEDHSHIIDYFMSRG